MREKDAGKSLAVEVEQAGRQFPQPPAEGVPVLVDQDDLIVVVQGDDRDRAVVFQDLPARHRPAGHQHLVGAQRKDLPDEKCFAGEGFEIVLSHGGRARE